MILSDKTILKRLNSGDIEITPFNRENLGSNSYDVTLQDCIMVYESNTLDAKRHNPIKELSKKDDGWLLLPNRLYLGATNERTFCKIDVPVLEGKSSTGRLGISIHATAGFGDIGFDGTWTLEISCVQPVIIYPNMLIGQVYFELADECLIPYNKKESAKYMNQTTPREYQGYKNFQK